MIDKKLALTYGAMLHDVGKVVYRGSSAHGTHSKLGADFIQDEIAPENAAFAGEMGNCIVQQIRYHHAKSLTTANLPDDSLAYVTYFADNISAGMDCKSEEGQEGFRFDRTVNLRKIFNIINGSNGTDEIEHGDYNKIKDDIRRGLLSMGVSFSEVNSLLNLLEATTSMVPSSTNLSELVDVSLYDHSKTTAAIAACIYEYLQDRGVSDYRDALFDQGISREYYETPMFLLCSCDMSGIQSFIYDISGDGALKQLRARSLYLELLLEHVSDEFLDRLELSRANLLYTGGGHAYLLLPNTEATKRILSIACEELQSWFLEKYRTDLYMAMAWVECNAHDLANVGDDKNRFGSLYMQLAQNLSEEKAMRYDARAIWQLNFAPEESYDHTRECTECHRSDTVFGNDGKCSLCSALEKISPRLVRNDVFVVCPEMSIIDNNSGPMLDLPFGQVLAMYSRSEYLVARPSFSRIYTKNSWDMGIKLSTHLWMGDYTADTHGAGISAYARCGATLKDGLGIQRLGVLRADVDNLGATFANGIPKDKASISRTATLSRMLSYFFKYQINQILEAGMYQVQIIYSGGDDLFLIGNWNDVIHAGMDIRSGFLEFTGNDSITISMGIGMFDEKYPIASMASETGELEDVAKLHLSHRTKKTKDALALWDAENIFEWDDFLGGVVPKLHDVEGMFDRNEKGRAFIYKLVALLRNTEELVSLPRLAYLLARSFEDQGSEGHEASMRLYSWANQLSDCTELVTALEWYVYSTRERG